MEAPRDRIRRELKVIAKDKNLVQHLLKHDESPKTPLSKCAQISEEFRDSGNQLYIQDDHCAVVHFQILQYYNKSIAYAPSGSETLALAFGSKSAFLQHLKKYRECICELDKALEITESVCLKIKLLCRKAECLTALGSTDNKGCLQKANFLFEKLEDSEKVRTTLRKFINKAQSVVNAHIRDRSVDDTVRSPAMKVVDKIEKLSRWESVKIDYSKVHGKHLVAARDFEPGEIITVEKPYQNHFIGDNVFEYCCYCLGFLWAAFPCNECSARLFCSKQCKQSSLNEYHDMECPALLYMEKMIPLEKYNDIPFAMSIFFKALKEAGGINQLQTDLESMDKQKGISAKIHSQDEKFSSSKSLYTLQVNSASKHKFDACARSAVIALIGLATGTQLFNQSYSPNDLQNLRKNDVAISVGELLLKFCLIITNRCHTSKLPDPEDLDESVERNCPDHGECSLKSLTKPTNFAVSVTSMMTIIRCFPNVDDCIVSGNKYVMFAIRPIKEGDKLCTSILSVYRNFPAKSERQAIHHEYYNCPCDCPACRGNWTELIRDKTKCNDLINSELKTITGSQISSKFLAITDESKAKSEKFERLDLQTLTKSKELVDKAWKYFRMPSPLIITSTRIMINTFYNVYGVGEKPSDLFRSCKKK